MIKLKEKINKTATMQELRKKAEIMYKHTYEGELRIDDFMSGANTLFNLLRLPHVSKSEAAFYCQSHIEGQTICSEQCDHCKEYYAPLERQ